MNEQTMIFRVRSFNKFNFIFLQIFMTLSITQNGITDSLDFDYKNKSITGRNLSSLSAMARIHELVYHRFFHCLDTQFI